MRVPKGKNSRGEKYAAAARTGSAGSKNSSEIGFVDNRSLTQCIQGFESSADKVYQLRGESFGMAYRRFKRWMWGNESLPANLYRWDPLGPEVVAEHGLPQRDSTGTVSLKEHVNGSADADGRIVKYESQWISTGAWGMLKKLDPVLAQQVHDRTLYRINPVQAEADSGGRKFKNVAEHFDDIGKKQPYPGQHEWALEAGISAASIVGYMTGQTYLDQYDPAIGGIPGGEAGLTGWTALPPVPAEPTVLEGDGRGGR